MDLINQAMQELIPQEARQPGKTSSSPPQSIPTSTPPGAPGSMNPTPADEFNFPYLNVKIEPKNVTDHSKTIITKEEIENAVHLASTLEYTSDFEVFNPYHKQATEKLIEVLYTVSMDDYNKIQKYAQKVINSSTFNYVNSIVLRHRPDILEKSPAFPSHITTAPYLYLKFGDLKKTTDTKKINEIIFNQKFEYEIQQRDLENRLEYFYDDPGINSHHRHWHEVYPDSGIVAHREIDRQGELFYYMHSQMLVRLNFERLSVGINFVKPLENFEQPIKEAYYNNLETKTGVRKWDSRPATTVLKDIDTAGIKCRIQDLELWRDRIYDAIDRGYVYTIDKDTKYEKIEPLNEPKKMDSASKMGIPVDDGINILGNIVLPNSVINKHHRYYGKLHNMGHMIIGYSHDSDGYFYKKSAGGAMTMSETACRDPVFWRWHQFVDDIFDRYKATLPEYCVAELDFPGIQIVEFYIQNNKKQKVDFLQTKFKSDPIDITDGIDYQKLKISRNTTKVLYEFVHLSYDPFQYYIKVQNTSGKAIKGVVRIFMFPVYVDFELKESLYRRGKEAEEIERKINPNFEPHFNKHRRKAMEMDRFVVDLKIGENEIIRESKQSSVTVPMQQLFMTVREATARNQISANDSSTLSWCGCGWPEYLLLPKGKETPEGLPCRVFVMITDYDKDKPLGGDNKVFEKGCNRNSTNECAIPSISFCGIQNSLYPDRKPMGFPFDRNIEQDNALLENFIRKKRDPLNTTSPPNYFSNMKLTKIAIKFENNSREFC